jgi:Zn-dependent protease
MGGVRHPFEPAPYAAGPLPRFHALPVDAPAGLTGGLSERDRLVIRGLRPEAFVPVLVTGGSALFSIALYSGLWSMPIACGLVLGMWAHELGHRTLLRRYGFEASPIVFVPFIGAVQRMRSQPADPVAVASVALAGPACGLSFAAFCTLGHLASGHPDLRLLGMALALLGLLDMLPFGPLDGGRIFGALGRRERIACAACTSVLAVLLQSLVLVPVCVTLIWAATRPALARGHVWVAAAFMALLCATLLLVR